MVYNSYHRRNRNTAFTSIAASLSCAGVPNRNRKQKTVTHTRNHEIIHYLSTVTTYYCKDIKAIYFRYDNNPWAIHNFRSYSIIFTDVFPPPSISKCPRKRCMTTKPIAWHNIKTWLNRPSPVPTRETLSETRSFRLLKTFCSIDWHS